ncbi:AAA family ATPase [Streptomyces boncukensis]|uniref:MinD/ParA family protein n=1 Tax=Streptomyces boncukensis TaxID=2711219 RepID=A0A6G4X1E4_9ACTN|nr:TadE/TadG family type IV pilus assembly protein [Streptomyces boncukensis]NGO70677.1 MinD/ParA family protein [Streptomyces boncukensis]
MVTRIQPAVSDPDAARSLVTLLSQLPDSEPVPPAIDSTQLLDTLAQLAGPGEPPALAALPEVVLVHELIGPLPALELIREVALRFPAVGVILVTQDTSPGLYASAMDAGARGVVGLPLGYEDLAARIGAAASWAAGVRRHLGAAAAPDGIAAPSAPGAGGTVVAVAGAKGGVGATLAAVQLALAGSAGGRTAALVDLDLQAGDVGSYLDVQFRRSVADLAGINDISPRVLQDAVYTHETGLGLLLAPAEGERGEDVDDRAARQIIAALRARYELVVVDCGTQMSAAGAAAVELADRAVLLTTPDVVSVRAAKRMVRLWERLQIRKAEETLAVVNRASRLTEIQPPLIARITGTPVARSTIPANFKELQSAVDAGRVQDLEPRGAVRQALWALAGELGIATGDPGPAGRQRQRRRSARRAAARGREKGGAVEAGAGAEQLALPPGPARKLGSDRGAVSVEFAGVLPIVLVVLVVLWQCVLIGYTFSLAGNAADEAARAATSAAAYGDPQGACEAAAREHLPGKWAEGARVSCVRSGGLWKADVDLKTPILFPGGAGMPFTVKGAAGAAEEGGDR